jgi:hypothetical protein
LLLSLTPLSAFLPEIRFRRTASENEVVMFEADEATTAFTIWSVPNHPELPAELHGKQSTPIHIQMSPKYCDLNSIQCGCYLGISLQPAIISVIGTGLP